jgi:hypothetical protein
MSVGVDYKKMVRIIWKYFGISDAKLSPIF